MWVTGAGGGHGRGPPGTLCLPWGAGASSSEAEPAVGAASSGRPAGVAGDKRASLWGAPRLSPEPLRQLRGCTGLLRTPLGGHTLSFLRPFHSVGPWGALLSRSPCVPRRTGAAVGDRGTGPRKAGCPASPEPPVGGHTARPRTALRGLPAGSTWVPGLHRALRAPDTHGQVLCLVASRERWPCSHFMVTVTDFSFVGRVGSDRFSLCRRLPWSYLVPSCRGTFPVSRRVWPASRPPQTPA